MHPTTSLIFDVATYLQGAKIKASAVLPIGRATLHLWAFDQDGGTETTLVVQRIERQFVRWKVFQGSLAEARQHCLRLQQARSERRTTTSPQTVPVTRPAMA